MEQLVAVLESARGERSAPHLGQLTLPFMARRYTSK